MSYRICHILYDIFYNVRDSLSPVSFKENTCPFGQVFSLKRQVTRFSEPYRIFMYMVDEKPKRTLCGQVRIFSKSGDGEDAQ